MKRLMTIKKAIKNKKGFTLIEIIVVLVILAILAAATIPTMIGFINDARGKADLANARLVLTTTQAALSEFPLNVSVIANVKVSSEGGASIDFNINTADPTANIAKATNAFASLIGTDLPAGDEAIVTIDANNKVTKVAYKSVSNKKTITINAETKEVTIETKEVTITG